MKVSYDWLRKYVPIKIRAHNLAEKLTMAGLEVTSTEKKEADFIFEIEITSNRPDWLSHIGIAREVSTILKKPLNLPVFSLSKYFSKDIKIPEVILQDTKLCPRYTARLITGVSVAPSPKWLIERIEAMGLRAINNVVDITNFVLFETGQPLHAFDYDKLKGHKIIIRKAQEQEEITTIDGEKRKFQPKADQSTAGKKDILIIADEERPVAIAGIMGGLNTEVDSSTKTILLESAYFDPGSIRKSSRTLGVSSDSSYRFERNVDIENIVNASDRAASLICGIAKAKTHKGIADAGKKAKGYAAINLRPERAALLLGIKVPLAQIKSILNRLGFKTQNKNGSINVSVPSFRRNDISSETDLIEEIARIYGYDNIPTTMPKVIATSEMPSRKVKDNIVNITRGVLTSLGFDEILTYSLISKEDLRKLDIPELNTISLQNPLSEQQQVLRNSLLPGALKAIAYNMNMGNSNLKLFEFSNIYYKENEDFMENRNLCLALCGDMLSDWNRKPQAIDIFYLKGSLVALFEKLGIDADAHFEELNHPGLQGGEALSIVVNNKIMGVMGKINSLVLEKAQIKTDVYAAEINGRVLFESCRLDKYFNPIIKFPSSYRDISVSLADNVSFGSINSMIKGTNRSMIRDVSLKEEYRGDKIAEGKRNLLIRITYQSKEKTLTEAEIEAADSLIRKKLVENFNANLR